MVTEGYLKVTHVGDVSGDGPSQKGTDVFQVHLVPVLPPGSASVTPSAIYWWNTAVGIKEKSSPITSPPVTSLVAWASHLTSLHLMILGDNKL